MRKNSLTLPDAKRILANSDYVHTRKAQNFYKKHPGSTINDYLDTLSDPYLRRIASSVKKGRSLTEARGHKDELKYREVQHKKKLKEGTVYRFRFTNQNYDKRVTQIDAMIASLPDTTLVQFHVVGNAYATNLSMKDWEWRSSTPMTIGTMKSIMFGQDSIVDFLRDYFGITDYIKVSKAGKTISHNKGIKVVDIRLWHKV